MNSWLSYAMLSQWLGTPKNEFFPILFLEHDLKRLVPFLSLENNTEGSSWNQHLIDKYAKQCSLNKSIYIKSIYLVKPFIGMSAFVLIFFSNLRIKILSRWTFFLPTFMSDPSLNLFPLVYFYINYHNLQHMLRK